MNVEKLKRLQSQVRIGGKGTPRRKKKVMHQTAAADDKKLQSSLKKLSVSTIPGIEEVNIIKDDLTVIHFNNPKAQASLSANTFAVTGHGETKKVVEMLPEILPQLGQDTVAQLRMFASSMSNNQSKVSGDKFASNLLANIDEDDVPLLVNDFDEIAKKEDHSKGKKSDKKDDSQEANQAKSLPPGVKKPNENIGSTLLEASKTTTNLKSKGAEKNKNTSPPAKGEKKEVNAQKGGANPKNLNQASTQNQKEKTLKSSPENMKHESKSKIDNLNMAPAYDLKDILNSLPLSEVTGIDVDNYAYVDRSAINSSAVKNNIATSPCPVQDVCPKPNLSPIDNASNLKSVEAVKPKLSEPQLTDLMMLEKSKNKEMKKSTNNLQQMVQTPNDKVPKKDVQNDDKKPKDTQLPSSPEVTAKAPLTSGNKPQVVQGMQAAIPVGAPVELGNKTEEVKDVKENLISAAAIQASAKKEQEEVQMKQFPPLPAAPALSLENKTIAIQEQQRMPKNIPPQQVTPDNAPMQIVQNKPPPQKVAQNSPLQEAAQNTTRLVAATLGLENKENLQGVPGESSQSNSSPGLVRLPGDMKAVPQPDVAPLSSLVSIAPTVPLEPSKETIMQTMSVPKEQLKVETSSSTPGLDTKVPFQGTTSVASESSSKEQMMPNRSDVAPKPTPTVSNKTAIQKTPQPKKAAINKDNGKQQVKSSSPTTPKAATDAAKKTDPSAKSKQMKPQVPTAPSPSTGAAPKPQTTSKSPPANQAAKQEKPAVSPRGKTSMSGQTKQQSPATPKPAITTQEKKSPAAPALSDPSTKAVATSVKSTPSTPEAKPDNNNLMKDKKANPQKVAAAESAAKSASPPKSTQPKVPEDQNKKSGQ